MKLNLTLPLPTSINKLYINQHGWNPKTKSRMPTGKRILSKEGEKNKKLLQKMANEQLINQEWDYNYTLENYIYMDTVFYFNRKGRDDNNAYKLLCDALEKIVYDNDSRVLVRTQKILYDTENPRVEVSFHPVEYRGIFINENKLNEFEGKCETCKRYKRNCSILNKAKEGRIREEVTQENDTYICNKYNQV